MVPPSVTTPGSAGRLFIDYGLERVDGERSAPCCGETTLPTGVRIDSIFEQPRWEPGKNNKRIPNRSIP